jgi:hypothetical protein
MIAWMVHTEQLGLLDYVFARAPVGDIYYIFCLRFVHMVGASRGKPMMISNSISMI